VLFGDEGMFVRSHISSVSTMHSFYCGSTMHSFGYIIINIIFNAKVIASAIYIRIIDA